VRVKREADMVYDHHLMFARLKIKLQKNWMMTATNKRTYNIDLVKDPQKDSNTS